MEDADADSTAAADADTGTTAGTADRARSGANADADADPGSRTATTPAGRVVHVDPAASDRGSKGPFHVAYESAAREARYGFYCANCGAVDAAVDTMGRVQCNRCRNVRKPEEWDAAHE